ncbi:MAG TPA: YceI family protein [Streptosporangiaceae bacterium]|nr:YceI family protein [Streptosporangiaceae bacterium]
MAMQQDHPATVPGLGRYAIDTSGSAVTFRTRHLFGLAPVRGTFAIRAGTIDIAEPLTDSAIYAEIETASFRTRSGQRDRSVRSARFLDAGRHPLMTFRSDRIDHPAVTGTLTVRGVTRPVSMTVDQAEVSPRSFTARASTRIDRTEFGVTASRGLAGRYLEVCLEVRCVRK